ncbi:hypothetical protein [Arthrobacter cryoconiti]|uniref:Uncharacterized protein n=1 Tax=Arthrobacter cryoconiti TaxID=748907 RepID=A0ABV8R3B0_9MICC|nr:hypothetical protein [Arthrobacter cryoconiti]
MKTTVARLIIAVATPELAKTVTTFTALGTVPIFALSAHRQLL